MIRVRHIIAVMVVLLILPGMVWGIDTEITRETLRGIKGGGVMIEDMQPEIERDGLTKNQIQTDVELKLRMAGFNVLSKKEVLKAPGGPWFGVVVNSFKVSRSLYAYTVEVELWQDVYFERNGQGSKAPTWSTGYLGIAPGLDHIRSKIKDYVDIFINAWLSVNPKQSEVKL